MSLVQNQNYNAALEQFRQSHELFPNQTALYNMALCLRLLDRPVEAVRAFEEHLDRFGTSVEPRRHAEVQQELENLRTHVGRIELQVEARRGAVSVNGEEYGALPLARPIVVTPGSHTIEVRAAGFDTFIERVSVEGGERQTLEARLTQSATPGRIIVDLALPGALITVDGSEVGTTPLSEPVVVRPGRHRVEASRDGYQMAGVNVDVAEGGEATATIIMVVQPNLPEDQLGTLQVIVDQQGATVLLDGQPLPSGSVPTGPHHLEVRAEGFETWTRDIQVGSGVTSRVDVALVSVTGGEGDESGGGGRGLRVAGWLLTGLGVLAMGASLGIYAAAGSQFDEWEQENGRLDVAFASETSPEDADQLWADVQENDDRHDTIATYDTVSGVMLGTGLALAAAGVVLIVLGYRSNDEVDAADEGTPRLSLLPYPGGLTLSGTFGGL